MQVTQLDRPVTLSDGIVGRAGDRIIALHLWSERIPVMSNGASIAWARDMRLRLDASFRELARYLSRHPELDDIALVRVVALLGGSEQNGQVARLTQRFGFEAAPNSVDVTLSERMHRFGENILVSLMVLARNAGALRRDTLRRDRVQVFISRERLCARWGSQALVKNESDSGGM